jgi:hypothetical protein
MATWADLLNYKQYVVRSDGAKFRDGVRDDNLDTSWLTISPTVSLGPGIYDELMVIPRVATQEEIEAWAQAQAPWYDPSPVIPDVQIPSAGVWNRKVRTYYQTTAPTAEGIGDIWFDTGDGNRPRWWDGSQWVDAHDKLPIDVTERPINLEGAGGYMDFDEQGFRAHRYSDNKRVWDFDVNTGNAKFAGELQAASGTFAGDITGSSGTFADGRVAIGDISGKPWGDGQLPAGTYGLWAPDGFVAASNTKVLQINDEEGTATSSQDWVDVPGFSLDFALDYSATVFIMATLWGGSSRSAFGATNAQFRLVINNEHPIGCTALVGGIKYDNSGTSHFRASTALQHLSRLPQGQHTVKLQFKCGTGCDWASIFHRTMSVLIIK